MNHEDVRLEDELWSYHLEEKVGYEFSAEEKKEFSAEGGKSLRMEVIIVHMSVIMVMGKEAY